jgi:hypothetical protein
MEKSKPEERMFPATADEIDVIVQKVRLCKDVVHDWDDKSPSGFHLWVKAFSHLASAKGEQTPD